jgi:hypothetical protein
VSLPIPNLTISQAADYLRPGREVLVAKFGGDSEGARAVTDLASVAIAMAIWHEKGSPDQVEEKMRDLLQFSAATAIGITLGYIREMERVPGDRAPDRPPEPPLDLPVPDLNYMQASDYLMAGRELLNRKFGGRERADDAVADMVMSALSMTMRLQGLESTAEVEGHLRAFGWCMACMSVMISAAYLHEMEAKA